MKLSVMSGFLETQY